MTALELLRALTHNTAVVVVTDAMIDLPGSTILYANAAFGRLVTRDPDEILKLSPRLMQGKQRRRSQRDAYRQTLTVGERFHGSPTDDHGDGTKYRVEIGRQALRGADGRVENFVSFEREVARRIGRPVTSADGRHEPTSVGEDAFAGTMRGLAVFQHA